MTTGRPDIEDRVKRLKAAADGYTRAQQRRVVEELLPAIYPELRIEERFPKLDEINAETQAHGLEEQVFPPGERSVRSLFQVNAEKDPEIARIQGQLIEQLRELRRARERLGLPHRPQFDASKSPVAYFLRMLLSGESCPAPLRRCTDRWAAVGSSIAIVDHPHPSISHVYKIGSTYFAVVFGGMEPLPQALLLYTPDRRVYITCASGQAWSQTTGHILRILLRLETLVAAENSPEPPTKIVPILGFNRNFGHGVINEIPGYEILSSLVRAGKVQDAVDDGIDLIAASAAFPDLPHLNLTTIKPRGSFFHFSTESMYVRLTFRQPSQGTSETYARAGEELLAMRAGRTGIATPETFASNSLLIVPSGRKGPRCCINEEKFIDRLEAALRSGNSAIDCLVLDGMTQPYRDFVQHISPSDHSPDEIDEQTEPDSPLGLKRHSIEMLTLPEKVALTRNIPIAVASYGSGFCYPIWMHDMQIFAHTTDGFRDRRNWDWHVERCCHPQRNRSITFLPNESQTKGGYIIAIEPAIKMIVQYLEEQSA